MSLLGAKMFFATRKASVPTALDYVQTGLIAMWDGIENAGWGVHDEAATTWKDLIGNRDLELFNATFTSNALNRSANSAGYLAHASQSAQGWAIKTVEFCCDLHYMSYIIPFTVATWDGFGYWLSYIASRSSTQTDACFEAICGNVRIKYQKPFQGGDVKGTICCKWDGGSGVWSGSGYFDGIPMIEDSTLPNAAGNPTSNAIDLGSNTIYNVYGSIHSARCYSRSLTAAEIAANYAIDKARFNLPRRREGH